MTRTAAAAVLAILLPWAAPALAAAPACQWQPAWASAQFEPDANNRLAEDALRDATLRQVVRVSVGGERVRVRVSNVAGREPLRIDAATVAFPADNRSARLQGTSLHPLSFGGSAQVVVPAGAEMLSDPVALPVQAFADLAVTLHFPQEPRPQTAHPGSRATSWIVPGNRVTEPDLPGATGTDHWFQLSGVDVERCGRPTVPVIVALGDSITDGRGSTTNGNDRWTDGLAHRLGGRAAVINQGIGGNHVLTDGLGPNALARLDRDVLALPGVRHLIVLEGINDIGGLTRAGPASAEAHAALVASLKEGFRQIVARAHAHGIKVHGGTILPFMGNEFYHPDAANEADRQALNHWIRTSGTFDSVIDFDAALRDPARPAWLDPRYDGGDRLHPNAAGYAAMAAAIPLDALK